MRTAFSCAVCNVAKLQLHSYKSDSTHGNTRTFVRIRMHKHSSPKKCHVIPDAETNTHTHTNTQQPHQWTQNPNAAILRARTVKNFVRITSQLSNSSFNSLQRHKRVIWTSHVFAARMAMMSRVCNLRMFGCFCVIRIWRTCERAVAEKLWDYQQLAKLRFCTG